MKLIKHTPVKIGDKANNFTTSEVMISESLSCLKKEAGDLCRRLGTEPTGWSSRHPIMGSHSIETNTEWMMTLNNGIVLSIES